MSTAAPSNEITEDGILRCLRVQICKSPKKSTSIEPLSWHWAAMEQRLRSYLSVVQILELIEDYACRSEPPDKSAHFVRISKDLKCVHPQWERRRRIAVCDQQTTWALLDNRISHGRQIYGKIQSFGQTCLYYHDGMWAMLETSPFTFVNAETRPQNSSVQPSSKTSFESWTWSWCCVMVTAALAEIQLLAGVFNTAAKFVPSRS